MTNPRKKEHTVNGIHITPIADVNRTYAARPKKPGKWEAAIREIESLETRAAQFVVPFVDNELTKFKRAFQRDARNLGHSAVFGDDHSDKNGTQVQVKLTERRRYNVGGQSDGGEE